MPKSGATFRPSPPATNGAVKSPPSRRSRRAPRTPTTSQPSLTGPESPRLTSPSMQRRTTSPLMQQRVTSRPMQASPRASSTIAARQRVRRRRASSRRADFRSNVTSLQGPCIPMRGPYRLPHRPPGPAKAAIVAFATHPNLSPQAGRGNPEPTSCPVVRIARPAPRRPPRAAMEQSPRLGVVERARMKRGRHVGFCSAGSRSGPAT